jgi:hypothetical protein
MVKSIPVTIKIKNMPRMDRTGPEKKGSKTGRGLGNCSKFSITGQIEKLGKGMGMRRNSGGGVGKGKRLKTYLN